MKTHDKVNPRRRPVTLAELKRAVSDATDAAVTRAIAIMFTCLLDKHGWTAEQLKALWAEVDKLSEEVSEGRVNVNDLLRVLRDEYEITIH